MGIHTNGMAGGISGKCLAEPFSTGALEGDSDVERGRQGGPGGDGSGEGGDFHCEW